MATHSSTVALKIPWTEELGAGYYLWGRKESGTTQRLHFHFSLSCIGEGNGNPLQFLPGEAQGQRSLVAAVYGVTESQTQLK